MLNRTEKLLLEAVIAFDNKANDLIVMLAEEYELNLNEDNPFDKLLNRSNGLWQGKSKDNWSYRFHGDSCEFVNSHTKQVLDVKINRKGNFGAIDNFYLHKFINTTPALRYAMEEISSSKVFWENMTSLQEKKYVIDIGDSVFSTRILNKAILQKIF